MQDKSPGGLMRSHDEHAEMGGQYRELKHDKTRAVADALEAAVESAVADTPPAAEVFEVNDTGGTYSLRLHLDRANLLHRLNDSLPEEFAVYNIWNDGTISVRWHQYPTGDQKQHDTTLRGIAAEATPIDDYWPIRLT